MKIKLTGLESGLLAYYKFDEGQGQTLANAVGLAKKDTSIGNAVLGLTLHVEMQDPTWSQETFPYKISLDEMYNLLAIPYEFGRG
jgi:hypothetical protein